MKKILRTFVLCLVVMMAASCANLPKRNMDSSVMVIPSRYTIVQFAFDLTRLRPITLVAYDNGGASLLLHVWNPSLQEWVRIDMDEYASGNLTTPAANRVHLLGTNEGIPAGMMDASQWAAVVDQIDSLNIATIVNSLDKHMKFSSSEWKSLAKKHKLTIKDANRDRRRYGRYGKRGEDVSIPMPEEEMTEELIVEPMPPAGEAAPELPPMIQPEDK